MIWHVPLRILFGFLPRKDASVRKELMVGCTTGHNGSMVTSLARACVAVCVPKTNKVLKTVWVFYAAFGSVRIQ